MIEYRMATSSDAEVLAKIRVDFLCEANNVHDEEEKEKLFTNNKQFMIDALSTKSFVAWLAISSTEIVATSGVSFYKLPPNKNCPSGKIGYISNMFTYPKYRKQGIASKLFRLIVEESKKRGHTKILLTATDQGRPIYEKYGFESVKNDMIYYIK